MGRILLISIVLLVIVWSYGIAKDDQPIVPLKSTLSTPKSKYLLGDWIEINLKIQNTGRERVKVAKPMIDFYSVSLKMEYVKNEKQESPITDTIDIPMVFTYAVFTPSVMEDRPEATTIGKIALEPGRDISVSFKVPAIRIGELKITALKNSAGGYVEPSNTLTVNIALEEKDKGKELVAVIDTNQGKIITRFYPNDAPNHVLNFVKLAKQGFYTKQIFHRVIKGFMIQGGSPKRDGSGDAGYTIKAEFSEKKHLEGTLAMARGPNVDSASCQFYICLEPQSGLDGQYTVFGEVIKGMDVVKKIGAVKTTGSVGGDRPLTEMLINKITIELMKVK